ncbi:MAG: glutaredoxin family protein [Culicoidibacterales bacterium]
MKIEIYGIPESLHKCYGCISAKKFFDYNKLPYTFHDILVADDSDLGFKYNTSVVTELKARMRKQNAPTNYPQIFVDNELIGSFNSAKIFFMKLGYET